MDKVLDSKTYEELETLEGQVKNKLDSDEAIDFDYWESVLRSIRVRKAKAKLRKVSQEIVNERLQAFQKQQADAAASVQARISQLLFTGEVPSNPMPSVVAYDAALDPEPMLKLRAEDKALPQVDEKSFLDNLVSTSHPDLFAQELTSAGS